jgi:hypothetical protein
MSTPSIITSIYHHNNNKIKPKEYGYSSCGLPHQLLIKLNLLAKSSSTYKQTFFDEIVISHLIIGF